MLGDYVGAGIEKCSSLHVHACSADGKGKAPPCLTLAYLGTLHLLSCCCREGTTRRLVRVPWVRSVVACNHK